MKNNFNLDKELELAKEVLETNRLANEEFAKAGEIYLNYVNNIWDTIIDIDKVLLPASISGLVAIHVVNPIYIKSLDLATYLLIALFSLSAIILGVCMFFKMRNLAPAIDFAKHRMNHVTDLAILERDILTSAREVRSE